MNKRDGLSFRRLTGRARLAVSMALAAVLLLASPAVADGHWSGQGDQGTDQGRDHGWDHGSGHGWGHGSGPGSELAVRVQDGRLVGRHGETVRLLGVNRSGTQYQCVQGGGIFDGPTDETALKAIRAWGANAVRVALNEHCWLGINSITPAGGEAYRTAIRDYVDRLNAVGLRVILDLHWNAPGDELQTDQQTMADRDHAPDFWRSVAETFRSNRSVVFDLYNEPHPDDENGGDTPAAWACVRDGGTCPGVRFEAAGMQELLDAVRSTGARNVVMVAGPQYAGQLDQWRDYRPYDPRRQLAASVHIYFNTPESPDWSPCFQQSCWEQTIAPLAEHTPVVIGEMGERDCSSGLIDGTTMTPPQDSLLDWADEHGVSYLAWSWMTSDCADEPALISSYDGTPTAYGAGIRDHLLGLQEHGHCRHDFRDDEWDD
jgi:endoglucanase